MSKQTSNFNLILPEGSDYYNISDANSNMTQLDVILKNISDRLVELSTTLDSKIANALANTFGDENEEALKQLLTIFSEMGPGQGTQLENIFNRINKLENNWTTEFITGHGNVHNTLNERLDGIDNTISKEASNRTLADDKIEKMVGTLSNLNTTNKNDTVSALNEVISNIGSLSSLKTSVKNKIVNAINSNYNSIEETKKSNNTLQSSFNFLNNRIKNVLLMDKSYDIEDYVMYSPTGSTPRFIVDGIKIMYYGRCIKLKNYYANISLTPTSATQTIYIGMAKLPSTSSNFDNSENYSMIVDGTLQGNTLNISLNSDASQLFMSQPLFNVTYEISSGIINPDSITYEWVSDKELPYIYNPNYMDHVTGIYNLIKDVLLDTDIDLNNRLESVESSISSKEEENTKNTQSIDDINSVLSCDTGVIKISNSTKMLIDGDKGLKLNEGTYFSGIIELNITKFDNDGTTEIGNVTLSKTVSSLDSEKRWEDMCGVVICVNTKTNTIVSSDIVYDDDKKYDITLTYGELNKLFKTYNFEDNDEYIYLPVVCLKDDSTDYEYYDYSEKEYVISESLLSLAEKVNTNSINISTIINDVIGSTEFDDRVNEIDTIYLLAELGVSNDESKDASCGVLSLSMSSYTEVSGNAINGSINSVIAFSLDKSNDIGSLKVVSYTDSLNELLTTLPNVNSSKLKIVKDNDSKYYLGLSLTTSTTDTTDTETTSVTTVVGYNGLSYNISGLNTQKCLEVKLISEYIVVKECYIGNGVNKDISNVYINLHNIMNMSIPVIEINGLDHNGTYYRFTTVTSYDIPAHNTSPMFKIIKFTKDIDRKPLFDEKGSSNNEYIIQWVSEDGNTVGMRLDVLETGNNKYIFDTSDHLIKSGSIYLIYVMPRPSAYATNTDMSVLMRLDEGLAYVPESE